MHMVYWQIFGVLMLIHVVRVKVVQGWVNGTMALATVRE